MSLRNFAADKRNTSPRINELLGDGNEFVFETGDGVKQEKWGETRKTKNPIQCVWKCPLRECLIREITCVVGYENMPSAKEKLAKLLCICIHCGMSALYALNKYII